MMVPVENREGQADQRRSGIALEIFAVGVADQEIHRLGEQQRAHMPEILAGPHFAVAPEWRRREQRPHLLFPLLGAVGRQAMDRLATGLHQEPAMP